MTTTVFEYDAKVDSKRRLTLRNSTYMYYHVLEMNNGTIVLEPRELTPPFEVSAKTLSMMDKSIQALRSGTVSAPIDLSSFED